MVYEPYQQRVVAERDELNRRMIILKDFRNPRNPVFASLGWHDKWLLSRKSCVMEDYLSVLNEQICLFNK